MPRKYYSVRAGKKNPEMDLSSLRKLFLSIYQEFSNKAYFDESLDDYCGDSGGSSGKVGDVGAYILRKIRKDNLWPIGKYSENFSEEDIFDLIEFLFDHVSAPEGDSGALHSFYGHYHYSRFDQEKGRDEFRETINEILEDYSEGYRLEKNGEISIMAAEELQSLLDAIVPTKDVDNIESKVTKAVAKFRKRTSTLDERHEAVRALADCLEYLRKDLANVITKKDDGDLFNIANNFGIRHHNDEQKTEYDRSVWLSWMFYFYLATIHAGLRLVSKGSGN